MSQFAHKPSDSEIQDRTLILQALEHIRHVLPAQAPIHDFVHHNTLHGYQHLPFDQALAESEALTGISAYLPESEFRHFYQQGRITDEDLHHAIDRYPELNADQVVCRINGKEIDRRTIYHLLMLHGFEPITLSQLNWQFEELDILNRPTNRANNTSRQSMHCNRNDDTEKKALWFTLCRQLALETESLHPENLLELTLAQTEEWLNRHEGIKGVHTQTRQNAKLTLDKLFNEVGCSITLRGLIQALTGEDAFECIKPQLIRLCASVLDEGIAPWSLPKCESLGLYGAWRQLVPFDAYPFLHEIPDWQSIVTELPETALDAIILQLTYFQIPKTLWEGYLRRLALELPGWAGMINWRECSPNYQADKNFASGVVDYLAIRLTLDRLWLNQITRSIWRIEAKFEILHSYFERNLSELFVRSNWHQGQLPEYLTHKAEALAIRADSERQRREDWQQLADLICTWQASPLSEKTSKLTVNNAGWRLFQFCLQYGLTVADIETATQSDLTHMLETFDAYTTSTRNKVWLRAYEYHYRDAFFSAIHANVKRGRWAIREKSPSVQVIFCMDDREEGFRRHLEELDPTIETLGAAGFFGLAMNYKGLDDDKVTPLCPVVVTPAHEVREIPKPEQIHKYHRHQQGRKWQRQIGFLFDHSLRNNPLLTFLTINLLAPLVFLGLLNRTFFPKTYERIKAKINVLTTVSVGTELLYQSTQKESMATPEQPQLGFTDAEQIDRVAAFLRNTGLTYGFGSLVILMGHGSSSQNNPHLAAYDCGACSGRHGGPNARLFAALANRPEVRKGLAGQGIVIPDDTWFIGTEHNTCNEAIIWYDKNKVPKAHENKLEKLMQQLQHACRMSAHERCRRLASAPHKPTPEQALDHIVERGDDFSQARPELGHATNATAVIGRRSVTQGAFFDRRAFLISYDCTQDRDGKILEGILLAVGPVGAGINLEYYFSTVNNDRLGCGTKVPHNIVGLFAVMEGSNSDLRTGLPRQMIEIHEAMRLQLLVEAKPVILEQIYERQESLRELIAGEWVLLNVIDPDSGQIFVFDHAAGFIPWHSKNRAMPTLPSSSECYAHQTEPVTPVLIDQPSMAGA
jgi:uncharacterized protein YbcC (UPF0753/DUF2309 family)